MMPERKVAWVEEASQMGEIYLKSYVFHFMMVNLSFDASVSQILVGNSWHFQTR